MAEWQVADKVLTSLVQNSARGVQGLGCPNQLVEGRYGLINLDSTPLRNWYTGMYTHVVVAEHHSLGITSGSRLWEGGREGGGREREGGREGKGGREGGREGREGGREGGEREGGREGGRGGGREGRREGGMEGGGREGGEREGGGEGGGEI